MLSTLSAPLPLILEGWGYFVLLFFDNNYMNSILQDIFSDYYEEMIYTLHPRQTVIENVDKMLHCGDPSYGRAMFGCPHCGNLKFVPFRCKSRFYPSCGNRYNQERSFHMPCMLVACVHRHCVFTIPEELRLCDSIT